MIRVRPARPGDAAEVSRILIASITALCTADHHDDPVAVANWLANKTPEGVAAMIASGGVRLAEREGQIVAVGEIDRDLGKITLNYVDPARRGQGVSTALLAALEAELAAGGVVRAKLTATATARAFYLARGWEETGPGRQGRWIVGYPMEKTLRG